MPAETILTKYRPDSFELCLGNSEVIKSLCGVVRSAKPPHAYLFTGSSGIGKTTLARIIAKEVKASIMEIDAASKGGVDDTRQLVEMAGYKPITVEPARLYIIDEAHYLSKQAWGPLLKLLEDCPTYLYVAICTTEPQKVPDVVKTRCHPVSLKPLKVPEVEELISMVAEVEEWTINNDVYQGIVQAAQGSARRALSILNAGHACATKDELSKIILEVDTGEDPVSKLCKYLVGGGRNWKAISGYLQLLDEVDDPVAHASRYMLKVIIRSEEEQAREISRFLHSFSHFNTYDKKVDFVSGVTWFLFGNVIF